MAQIESTPKVSILLPTYNSEKFLDEAIQSALNQTFTDFELIIVDNHSTDNSEAIITPYLADKRVRYYRNDSNIGLLNNWNLALTYAKGEYIKFLCSDDRFHPQILEKFVPIMDQHPNVSLITSDRGIFGAKNYTWKLPFNYLQNGYKMIAENLRDCNFLGEPTTVMFRRSGLQVGVFSSEYKYLLDWDMWLRLLTIGDCYIVPETLSFFRIHDNQVTTAALSNLSNYFEEYHLYKSIKLNDKLKEFISEAELKKLVKLRAMFCAKAIVKVLMSFKIKNNLSLINKAIKIQFAERIPLHYYGKLFSKKKLSTLID